MTLRLTFQHDTPIYSSDTLPILSEGDLVLAEDRCAKILMTTGAFTQLKHLHRAWMLRAGPKGYRSARPGYADDTLSPEDH